MFEEGEFNDDLEGFFKLDRNSDSTAKWLIEKYPLAIEIASEHSSSYRSVVDVINGVLQMPVAEEIIPHIVGAFIKDDNTLKRACDGKDKEAKKRKK